MTAPKTPAANRNQRTREGTLNAEYLRLVSDQDLAGTGGIIISSVCEGGRADLLIAA